MVDMTNGLDVPVRCLACGPSVRYCEGHGPETATDVLRRDLAAWKARALLAEHVLRSDPRRVVVMRGDWNPHIERIHTYARLDADEATVLLDADAVRLACVALGLELKR